MTARLLRMGMCIWALLVISILEMGSGAQCAHSDNTQAQQTIESGKHGYEPALSALRFA